jgi:hypothetical protein
MQILSETTLARISSSFRSGSSKVSSLISLGPYSLTARVIKFSSFFSDRIYRIYWIIIQAIGHKLKALSWIRLLKGLWLNLSCYPVKNSFYDFTGYYCKNHKIYFPEEDYGIFSSPMVRLGRGAIL